MMTVTTVAVAVAMAMAVPFCEARRIVPETIGGILIAFTKIISVFQSIVTSKWSLGSDASNKKRVSESLLISR